MKMFKTRFASALILCAIFLACSDDKVAGGVTDIENSVAEGVVVSEAGDAIIGARVIAYYDNWESSQSDRDSIETVTDKNGNFSVFVDSTQSIILYAEYGENSGLYNALSNENRLVVGAPRKLQSKIAHANSGYMRIVGKNNIAQINAKGEFAFDSLPIGDISLVYVASDVPRAHFDFSSAKSNSSSLVIPTLENLEENNGWLTVSDYRYYKDSAFGGIYVNVPENIIVPVEPEIVADSSINILLKMDCSEIVYDNDSTLAANVEYVEGIVDSAIMLKPGQFIELDSLDPCANDFTLSLWTKWEGPNGRHQILFSQRAYWSDSTSRIQWHYENYNGWFTVMKSMPGYPYGVYFGDSSIVPIGEWTHLALVSKDNMVSMFVNGNIVSFEEDGEILTAKEFVPNNLNRAVPFRIGGDEIFEETWNGAIDEVKIENVAQSAETIKAYYESYKK